ncbi:hypothetical protein QYF36_024227 [Acer negundo]|nr:hypothetical protein QYF36_024227 [Acer negundo]
MVLIKAIVNGFGIGNHCILQTHLIFDQSQQFERSDDDVVGNTIDMIGNDLKHTNNGISDNLRWMAYGTRFEVMKYSGYDINDHRYWTKNRDMSKIHNNSGVMIMDSPNGNNNQEDVSRLSLHPPIRKRKGRRKNISNVDGHEDDASHLKPSKKSTVVQTESANADDQENVEQSQLHSPPKKHKGKGRTMLKKVTKARSSGQKIVVQFNKKGKLRNDQKDRQSNNKYPHRLSRSGYVGLEEELKEDYGTTEDFDRHVLWMAARENATGDYEGEKFLSFVDKIEEIRKEVHEDKIFVDGNNDILTMAFGKPEHCGRLKGKYCKLAVGSKSNVVALGTIMPTNGPDPLAHGIPLNGNARVTIDMAIKGSALLQIPLWGSSKKVSMNKMSKQLVAQPEVNSVLKQSIPQPNQVNSSHNQFQDYINNLYTYAVKTMLPNVPIEIPFEENVFGHNYTACLFQDDLMQFCSMKMISIQCITFYMRHLYEMLKDQKLVDMYVLVDPNVIASYISNADDRARNLATRLENTTSEQIFLALYHHEYVI